MVELGESSDPTVLVPGDVGAVDRAVANWRGLAAHTATIRDRVKGLGHPSGWTGGAADAYAAKQRTAASTWTEVHVSLTKASSALDEYATVLGWAQQKAGDAVEMWERAEVLTAASQPSSSPYQYPTLGKRWSATTITPPQVDPGADLRTDAKALLAYARNEVLAAGDTAASALQAAQGLAPDPVGFWSEVGAVAGVAGTLALDQAGNVLDGVASFGNALLQHPDELAEILGGVGLMVAGASGEVGGGILDATGIGAIAGVPANIASAALLTGGAAAISGGVMQAAAHAGGDSAVDTSQWGVNRGDGRDVRGTFAPKQDVKPWVDKEKVALDKYEKQTGDKVFRDKIKAIVPGGNPNGRFYDGLVENGDETYTAIEVKSGTGKPSPEQRVTDALVSPSNPGVALLNGKSIQITRVIYRVVD